MLGFDRTSLTAYSPCPIMTHCRALQNLNKCSNRCRGMLTRQKYRIGQIEYTGYNRQDNAKTRCAVCRRNRGEHQTSPSSPYAAHAPAPAPAVALAPAEPRDSPPASTRHAGKCPTLQTQVSSKNGLQHDTRCATKYRENRILHIDFEHQFPTALHPIFGHLSCQ
jgi:hypothetical protein